MAAKTRRGSTIWPPASNCNLMRCLLLPVPRVQWRRFRRLRRPIWRHWRVSLCRVWLANDLLVTNIISIVVVGASEWAATAGVAATAAFAAADAAATDRDVCRCIRPPGTAWNSSRPICSAGGVCWRLVGGRRHATRVVSVGCQFKIKSHDSRRQKNDGRRSGIHS